MVRQNPPAFLSHFCSNTAARTSAKPTWHTTDVTAKNKLLVRAVQKFWS